RKTHGLALNQSILANGRLALEAVWPLGARRRSRRLPGIFDSLELVARGGHGQEVRFLSGGNQQKVVLAKWLAADPGVIVLDEPTRGIDVGAKQAVYRLMRELTADGVAILLISSELPELIGMADRLVVLDDGRVAGELPGGSDEEAVMALATWAPPEEEPRRAPAPNGRSTPASGPCENGPRSQQRGAAQGTGPPSAPPSRLPAPSAAGCASPAWPTWRAR